MSGLQQFCVKCGGAISFDISQAGTSIFCLHCGQQVQLKSDSATHPEPSESSPPPPAINDTPEEIFLLIDNQQHGPYSEANLSEYLKAGQVTPETLVWWEGKEGWEPLSQQTELNLGLTSSSRGSDLAPTAIAPECPNGHGETREWEGSWRCWECGWKDNSDPKKKPKKKKKKKKPNKWEESLTEMGCFLVVLVCFGSVAYLVYDLFLADGNSEKKEMADLKQRLEAILPAEEAFLAVIDSEPKNQPDNDYGWILGPSSVGRIVAAQATLEDKSDGLSHKRYGYAPNDNSDFKLAPYESQKVKKLSLNFLSRYEQHMIAWSVWYSMHKVKNPLVRKLDIKVLREFNAYKRERKVVLDELDREFQSYGLGSLKR